MGYTSKLQKAFKMVVCCAIKLKCHLQYLAIEIDSNVKYRLFCCKPKYMYSISHKSLLNQELVLYSYIKH